MLRTTVLLHPAGGGEPTDLAQLWVAQIRRGAGVRATTYGGSTSHRAPSRPASTGRAS